MKRDDRKKVVDVLEAHTRRVALGDLAKKGKSHVRVISGEKAMELIEAVVDRTIARRAGELADLDRDRIVKEAGEQFDRVSRMQAEAEELVRRQSALIEKQGARIEQLESGARQVVAAVKRRDRRLANSRETILNYDKEIERLATQVTADAKLIDELQRGLRERTEEVKRLHELVHAGETSAVGQLKSELSELKEFLHALDQRGTSNVAELENRFQNTMDETLDRIGKTLRAATARPIDHSIEATDVLVSKIFDGADEMDSNLNRLDVEVSTTQDGIAKSLDRLKRLRETLPPDLEDETEAAPPA